MLIVQYIWIFYPSFRKTGKIPDRGQLQIKGESDGATSRAHTEMGSISDQCACRVSE